MFPIIYGIDHEMVEEKLKTSAAQTVSRFVEKTVIFLRVVELMEVY